MPYVSETGAREGRFLKVGKSAKRAPILDLRYDIRLGRLWEERRASAGEPPPNISNLFDSSTTIIIPILVAQLGFRSTYSLWSCKAWAKVVHCGGR
jgi:hypothetical protein